MSHLPSLVTSPPPSFSLLTVRNRRSLMVELVDEATIFPIPLGLCAPNFTHVLAAQRRSDTNDVTLHLLVNIPKPNE